jgi:hypothetical protein|tara:strand:- start:74 stop:496 length:423 start_codon:yes stop_codon:yes gene_type:complete
MAFVNLAFNSGAILTSSSMNALQENFTAVASQSTGAPRYSGIPRAWVSFAADRTIEDSFLTSSIDDLGTGKYRINWTTAFSGHYMVTWGFKGGLGQTSNVAVNITLYTVAAGNVELKGRNANTTSSGDTAIPMSVCAWQE